MRVPASHIAGAKRAAARLRTSRATLYEPVSGSGAWGGSSEPTVLAETERCRWWPASRSERERVIGGGEREQALYLFDFRPDLDVPASAVIEVTSGDENQWFEVDGRTLDHTRAVATVVVATPTDPPDSDAYAE